MKSSQEINHFVAETEEDIPPATPSETQSGAWLDAWRILRTRPLFIVSALLILLIVLVACFPQWFAQADPNSCDLRYSLEGPGFGHILGYNTLGCDIFARTIHGAQASLFVGAFATLGVVVIGGTLGVLAGFYGGWLDSLISRLVDIVFTFPLILGVFIITFLPIFNREKSLWTTALPLMILSWPIMARITRGAVLNVKNADYIMAVRSLGASPGRIILRHILPNSLAPMITTAIFTLGSLIAVQATLSYLGYQPPDTPPRIVYALGMPASEISWANDIAAGVLVIRTNPEIIAYPTIALVITILSFLMLGEAVGSALNPKERK